MLNTSSNESGCFNYLLFKDILQFSENIYAINMSKHTLKCTNLHLLLLFVLLVLSL